MEEQKSFLQAADFYVAYADRYGSPPFAAIVLKAAARCYVEAGDLEKAKGVLQRIVENYKESTVARAASAELKKMGVVN
jgi:pentatricopeptide repeat protein